MMKQKILYPFLLGALGMFFTAPYNMSHSLTIACLAVMGHYFIYGIALRLKWQYSPMQLCVFLLAQPILYTIDLPFEADVSQIQQSMPYLFPILVPVFTIVAGLSLFLGYLWTLEKMKKSFVGALTFLWISASFFLCKEGLPRMSFDRNVFVSTEKMPVSTLKGLNTSDFTPEMYAHKKTYFLCWEPVMWADERQLRRFQRLYDVAKNMPNVQIGLIVCHSAESMTQTQIAQCLAGYTFPIYEDKTAEWFKFSAKHHQAAGVLINEKGQTVYEITNDFDTDGAIWLEEMNDLLAVK